MDECFIILKGKESFFIVRLFTVNIFRFTEKCAQDTTMNNFYIHQLHLPIVNILPHKHFTTFGLYLDPSPFSFSLTHLKVCCQPHDITTPHRQILSRIS